MAHNLMLALQITVIGMTLVFAAILLFWLIMTIAVRLGGARRPPESEPAAPPDTAAAEPVEMPDLRRQVAIAAVAAAIAVEGASSPPAGPTAAHLSPWQAASRSRLLGRRGRVP